MNTEDLIAEIERRIEDLNKAANGFILRTHYGSASTCYDKRNALQSLLDWIKSQLNTTK